MADHGTPERTRQLGGTILEVRIAASDGGTILTGSRARYECLLDILQERGLLGVPDAAEARYRAALWFRRLYQRTHGQRMVFDYAGLDRDRGHGDMSDALAWNLRAYGDTMRDLGANGPEIERVCGEDRVPRDIVKLRAALDILVKRRRG